MKFSLLPILIGFLSGLALDLTLSRFMLDIALFCTVLVTVAVALLMAHHHSPRKKSRSQSKVVKFRKKSSGTSGRRLSNFNR